MNWLRLARARLVGFFRKEELESEIDEELRFHVAMRTQENIRRGMPEADAAREARQQFGKIEQIKDDWRDVSGGGALENFAYDVRFGARMLLKDRAFTIVAVVALALGIGANTALFTVLSNVLLRPLPYPRAEAIMSVAPLEKRSAAQHPAGLVSRLSRPARADALIRTPGRVSLLDVYHSRQCRRRGASAGRMDYGRHFSAPRRQACRGSRFLEAGRGTRSPVRGDQPRTVGAAVRQSRATSPEPN